MKVIKHDPRSWKKMAHEFVEYRPYSSIEEFKREIENMQMIAKCFDI